MHFFYCVLYLALVGVAFRHIGNALPRNRFHAERFPFRAYRWENGGACYLRLGIRWWKDKLPDMSRVCRDMYPKVVDRAPNADNFVRLIQESCVAECIHLALIVFSLPVLRIWPGRPGQIIYALYALGNLPFIMIQRYNRPRLQHALELLRSRQLRGQKP